MKKKAIYFGIFLLISSCIKEAPLTRLSYNIINNSDNNLIIKYWGKKDGIPTFATYELQKNEKKNIENPSGIIEPNLLFFAHLGSTDSIQIIFADGKIKTDRSYEKHTDKPNMYNDNYYDILNCGQRCYEFIYTVDEKDYAEAK